MMLFKYYYKNIRLFLIVSILGIFINLPLIAQSEDYSKRPLYKSFNLNFIAGAQMYNDNFLYNPGYSLDFSLGKYIDDDIGIGLATAVTNINDKIFIPICLEVIGKKKNKSNTPIIRFQGGYSIGWDEATTSMVNYDMKGGFYFSAGLGREISIQDKLSILFQWSFCHQFAKVQYQAFGDNEYSETLNYDMFKFSIGFLFH